MFMRYTFIKAEERTFGRKKGGFSMKKAISVMMAAAMLTACMGAAGAESCTATEKGFGGDVSVTLTIENDVLKQVEITGEHETVGIGQRAIEEMAPAMVKKNSVEVDALSGATITSTAILNAAKAALAQSGAQLTANETEDETVTYEDTKTQVVVVGAGIAGMTAAMELKDAGIDVIVLEKGGVIGGAATTSAGAIWAIGAKETSEIYDFTADELYDFFNKQAGPVHNKDVFYALAGESLNSKTYMESLGVTFPTTFQCNPSADTRFNGYFANNSGIGMIEAMSKAFYKRDIDLRLGNRMTELVQAADGSITGVKVQAGDSTYTIEADKVLLATGGFGQNPEMCAEYIPDYAVILSNMTISGATGDGHQAAWAVGAGKVGEGNLGFIDQLMDMEIVQFGMPLTVATTGEQVCPANEHYTHMYEVIKGLADPVVYCIYPADIANYTPWGDQAVMERHVANGELVKADTIEELAQLCGIDADTLVKTVEEHNRQCDAGESDAFDTPLEDMIPVKVGPYYAYARHAAMIGTITAVTVDEHMHVTNENGEVIPNLYAAGEMIFGNWFNSDYPMSGTGLSSCVSGARIASAEMAELLK